MSLAPKPPPTSGAITRTWCGGRSSRSQMNWRTWCGTWEDAHTVRSSGTALYSATSPRVSIGWPPAAADAQASRRRHARRRAQRGLDVAARQRHAPGEVVGDVVVHRGRARRRASAPTGAARTRPRSARARPPPRSGSPPRPPPPPRPRSAHGRRRAGRKFLPAERGMRRHDRQRPRAPRRDPRTVTTSDHAGMRRARARRRCAPMPRVSVRAPQDAPRGACRAARCRRRSGPRPASRRGSSLRRMPVADELHAGAVPSPLWGEGRVRGLPATSSAACTMC